MTRLHALPFTLLFATGPCSPVYVSPNRASARALANLRALPAQIAAERALLQRGLDSGYTSSVPVIATVIRQVAENRAPVVHPAMRRLPVGGFTEGWGIDAEDLADETGLYDSDLLRAGWLVHILDVALGFYLDIGYHAAGRNRFNLPEFHREIIRDGTITLASMRAKVDRWIAERERGAAVDTVSRVPSSAEWLALLPEGEEKRRFILDCTGCHQFHAGIARAGGSNYSTGRARTREEWESAIRRMLGFSGASSGFPVISAYRDAAKTAAWLAASLGDRTPSARGDAPSSAVTEFMFPAARDIPHDLAIQEDGSIVVTGMFTHRMYVLDPAANSWTETPIPVPNANPRAVELDSAGNWWIVLGGPNQLAKYQPETLRWRTYDVGMYAHSLAITPTSHVWFNGHFTVAPEQIGRVGADGTIRTFDVPAHPQHNAAGNNPVSYEIRAAPDGRIWMGELTGNRLVSFDPATQRFDTVTMPVPHSGPRRFDIARDGVLWIPAYGTNELVRFDPRSRAFTRFALPMQDAVPYMVRLDHALNRVWVATSAGDVVYAFDPTRQSFRAFHLPTRGALVRHLAVDSKSHELWVAYGQSPGIPARIARIRP